jgi:hypothetical protein
VFDYCGQVLSSLWFLLIAFKDIYSDSMRCFQIANAAGTWARIDGIPHALSPLDKIKIGQL